jgi:beta-lactam-binding protein with PASTA domain
MDDQNQFLNSYKKRLDEQKTASGQVTAESGQPQATMRYEDKSEFVPVQGGAEPFRPVGGKKVKTAVYILISAIIIIALIIGIIWFLNRGVAVIDLNGWIVNDAQLWAKDNDVKLQIEEQYNDQTDTGKIFAQNPAAGGMVNQGGFVRISVSLGHDLTVELPLPDLMAMTKADIETWAAENFMTKVRITAEFSDKIASGQVVSYEINDTRVVDKVKRDTPIYIIVSKGKEDQAAILITVPNFKEMSIAQSYEFAKENGIVLKVIEDYDDFAPAGSIIAQSVKAAEKVGKGAEISVTVSKGKKILMPNFAGYSRQQAAAVIAGLGIHFPEHCRRFCL